MGRSFFLHNIWARIIKVTIQAGVLYIVATPIGNLGDISTRALEILRQVSRIAAEDTRHSAALLRHYAIDTPMLSLHEHNERHKLEELLGRLQGGEQLALISDAGTPLISDPGYHLVQRCHQAGIKVVPIPGPSALITALCASGLPTDRFSFEGFLPNRSAARSARLEPLKDDPRTLVFYESPHRILDSLQDMVAVFGPERSAVLARELTKTFETIHQDSLAALSEWVAADANQQKGEIVLLIKGAEPDPEQALSPEARRLAAILAEELPLKQAAALAARISGEKKNALYQFLLEQK
ncbi:MAG: 16S rRNA (cytidine(1402)-2'-O)-methyltransferase [Chromatiales bacterium]|nr:16S rRNA (cytidine(1402)-2'-O)-methyltransferase [Gammaproteobacteria bacterium]MBW6476245.1 16S rRNA (cytidine(1402)-2'-O)-methyltransferase [Chromatiales bacterium]